MTKQLNILIIVFIIQNCTFLHSQTKFNLFSFSYKPEISLSNNPVNRGNLNLEKGKMKKAGYNYRSTLNKTHFEGESNNNLGVLYTKEMKYTQATCRFQLAQNFYPDSVPEILKMNLFNSYMASADFEEALYYSCEIENNEQVKYNLGLAYSETGNFIESEKFYTTLMYEGKLKEKASINSALNNYNTGDYENALYRLQPILEKSEYAKYIYGVLLAENGQSKKACSLFNGVKEGDNEVLVAIVNNGIGLTEKEELLSVYKILKKAGRKDAATSYALGNIMLRTGNPEKAIFCFRDAIFLDTVQAEYYVGIANSYNQSGDYRQADNYFKKALEIDSQDYYACSGMGTLYYNQGNFDSSAFWFNKSMPLLMNSDQGYGVLVKAAYSNFITGNFSGAFELAEKATKIDSTQASAYAIKALIYYYSGNSAASLENIDEAISRDKRNNQYHELLGSIYMHSDRFREARKCFSKALISEPLSKFALNGYALSLNGLGKSKIAIRVFNHLIRNCDSVSYFYNNRSIVKMNYAESITDSMHIKKKEKYLFEALSDLDTAMYYEPNAFFNINKGNAYNCLNNDSVAILHYNYCPGEYQLNNTGAIYALKNDFKTAREYFVSALKEDSLYDAALFNLTLIKNEHGLDSDVLKKNYYENRIQYLFPGREKYYFTYLYYLPVMLAPPESDSFLNKFVSCPLNYCGPELNFQLMYSDAEYKPVKKYNLRKNQFSSEWDYFICKFQHSFKKKTKHCPVYD